MILKDLGRENLSLNEDVLLLRVIELPVIVFMSFGIISPLLNTCLGKIIIYYLVVGN